jgi:chromosome segregation ATPase
MSPLKIALLFRMYSQPRPNRDLPERQAFAPAMHEALRDFKSLGLAHPLLTIVDLQAGTGPAEKLTAAGRQLVDLHLNAQAEIAARDARIAELEAPLRAFHDEVQGTADQHMLHLLGRIAELESELKTVRYCHTAWLNKTEWVQDQGLGMIGDHRADAIRSHVEEQTKRIAELEADRRVLQSTGEHPAPCARHCEANAFRIELRNKDARIAELEAELASRPLTMAAAQKLYDRTRTQAERIAELDKRIAEENKRILDLLEDVAVRNKRIAELEKQVALDKTLLDLADMRVNRAMQELKGGA